jgi:hypothetical protein
MDLSPRRHDALAGLSRETVCLHDKRAVQLSVSKDRDQFVGALDNAGDGQRGRVHLRPGLEAVKSAQVDRCEPDSPRVTEAHASREGQLANKWKLAALEVWSYTATAAGVLTLGTTPSCLALSRRDTASDALPIVGRPRRRLKVVQFHHSSPVSG